jgi:protein-tyrosine phosphatase
VRILIVCRANVCRSRVGEALLRASTVGLGADVGSAGVDAVDRPAVCGIAEHYLRDLGVTHIDHHPRQFSSELADSAGLVLTAETPVTARAAEISPGTRNRTFRLAWAAAALDQLAAQVAVGDVPAGAPPLPPRGERDARWAWLVGELDAARGHVPVAGTVGPEVYDVPDPHARLISHPDALNRIAAACKRFEAAVRVVILS